MLSLLNRKSKSLIKRSVANIFSYCRCVWISFWQDGVQFGRKVHVSAGARIRCTDGGHIFIGSRTSIGRGSEVLCQGGRIVIGSDVYIGGGCVIVSREEITIGRDSQIAEYCTVRDQDHILAIRPIRSSGFKTAPVIIGDDCWLGAKVTVLRGSIIGSRAVVGAHALVRGRIEPSSLSVGCPARFVKSLHE